jgi:hypothetical protein
MTFECLHIYSHAHMNIYIYICIYIYHHTPFRLETRLSLLDNTNIEAIRGKIMLLKTELEATSRVKASASKTYMYIYIVVCVDVCLYHDLCIHIFHFDICTYIYPYM